MHFRDICIHKFKGIDNFELNGLEKINVILGKNNTCKSSILHALAVLGSSLNTPTQSSSHFHLKRKIHELFPEPDNFKIKFRTTVDYKPRLYTFSIHDFNAKFVHNSPDIQFEIKSTYGDQAETNYDPRSIAKQFTTIYIEPSFNSGNVLSTARPPREILENFKTTHINDYSGLELLYALKQHSEFEESQYQKENYDRIINSILKYFPDITDLQCALNIENVAVLNYKEEGMVRPLDIIYSGTGLRTFLEILIKIEISQAKIVLLDEPEKGLHPDQQRKLMEVLIEYAEDKNIQFFITSHSHVFLNYPDNVTFYRAFKDVNGRSVSKIEADSLETVIYDLGLRASDLFNSDICLLVEGATDVVFFEHIIRTLYKEDFKNCSVCIQQYGGGAALGIIDGSIHISNLTPNQTHTFWIHDRDARPDAISDSNATKFINRIKSANSDGHILSKREIEFYFPIEVHVAAQETDKSKEVKTIEIFNGSQEASYDKSAKPDAVCVPSGIKLRRLLKKHLTSKEQLDQEIREIIENTLLVWKKQIVSD